MKIRKKNMKIICNLFFAFAIFGCAVQRPNFREIGTYCENSQGEQTKLENFREIESTIVYEKMEKKEKNRMFVETILFSVTCQNISNTAITLHPMNYYLLDDEGCRMNPKWEDMSGNVENFTLLPKSSFKMTLLFALPSGYDVNKIGSLRIFWNYTIAGNIRQVITKFLKQEIEYRYYEPYPYWGHWGHWGHGYYGRAGFFCR